MSVDGTDCPVEEPSPFSTAWYSHKFRGPAVRYEVALSIHDARIVWASGPWPAGQYPDLKVFQQGLKPLLKRNEFVIADSGYPDTRCIHLPSESDPTYRAVARIRARHEIANKRLKHFSVLKNKFRHSLDLHGDCFFAVLNITHVLLYENPLFHIELSE